MFAYLTIVKIEIKISRQQNDDYLSPKYYL